jgi:hypothetical protein
LAGLSFVNKKEKLFTDTFTDFRSKQKPVILSITSITDPGFRRLTYGGEVCVVYDEWLKKWDERLVWLKTYGRC